MINPNRQTTAQGTRRPLKARNPRALQTVGMIAAAVLSFTAALWAQDKLGIDRAGDDEVVQPVLRRAVTTSAAASASMPVWPVKEVAAQEDEVSPPRMDDKIVQDPFGPLNPGAGNPVPDNAVPPPPKSPAPISAKVAPAVVLPAVEAPPSPPMAPPLPFTSLGGIQSPRLAEGAPTAFLKQGEDVLVVRPGDEIGGLYKVESITTDRMVVTYLPLKQQQILNLRP